MDDTLKKLFQFLKLASTTIIFQGLIQFIGMLIGFYVVRLLSIQEYAYYTIANTVLGMMAVISNCGVTYSAYSQSCKVYKDKEKLGAVIKTSIKFRAKLSFISIIICIPILIYMLDKQNASWYNIVLISIALFPAFLSGLTDALYEIVPLIHQDLGLLQKNQIIVALLRLLVSGVFLVIFPFTWIALLANGIPRIIGNIKLKQIVLRRADLKQATDLEVEKETIRIVKRTAPGVIYYAFSGQITLFILSHMGITENLAIWGALGRFAVIFVVLNTVVNNLLIPVYSKLDAHRKELIIMSHKILLIAIIISGPVFIFSYFNSNFMLGLLGGKYLGFNSELIIIILTNIFSFLSGVSLNFSMSRGWIIHPLLDLSINLSPILILPLIISFDSLFNVLIFGLLCSMVSFIGYYFSFWFQLISNTKELVNPDI